MTHVTSIKPASTAAAQVDRTSLKRAAVIVDKIMPSKAASSGLSSFLVHTAASGNLALTGSNGDCEITAEVETLAADSRFAVSIPAKTLLRLCNKCRSSETVSLQSAVSHVTADDLVRADEDKQPIDIGAEARANFGGVEYGIKGTIAATYPHLAIPKDPDGVSFTMSGSTLWSAFDRVKGAISTEETRYYLNGIYMHAFGKELAFVTTDGHRLYRQLFDLPKEAKGMPGVIIPRDTIKAFLHIWKDRNCPVSIDVYVSGSVMTMSSGGVTIKTKLIDGSFPDYQRVMPTQNDKRGTISSDELSEAIASVSAIGAQTGRSVMINIDSTTCRLTVNDPEAGTATTTVECNFGIDEDFDVRVNARYLLDAIDVACPARETMTISFSDNGSPIVFQGGSPRFTGVLMPTRV